MKILRSMALGLVMINLLGMAYINTAHAKKFAQCSQQNSTSTKCADFICCELPPGGSGKLFWVMSSQGCPYGLSVNCSLSTKENGSQLPLKEGCAQSGYNKARQCGNDHPCPCVQPDNS